MDLRAIAREVVQPFVAGVYVPDWPMRAAQAGALSDYYSLRQSDDPFFEIDDIELGGAFGSRAILRQRLHQGFSTAFASTTIGYAFPMYELAGDERRLFEEQYGNVDSVEKMAMSAIAWAICHLSPTRRELLVLCGQLYDEALHLTALSTLLGIDQSQQPWITAKRAPFWTFARAVDGLDEYVLFQNCLSEGEGALAAAEIQYALSSLSEDSPAVRVARRITAEESHHALLGYLLLRQRDARLGTEFFEQALARYRTVEPLRERETPKGHRQRFAVRLLRHYIDSRSVANVEEMLVRAVDQTRRIGTSS